ncbi:MAG: hypothetical protein RBR52_03550 [Thiomonas sp.]|uniref:hypothetical protein n=1 Tax=Thiomonas sp. TaxID=2047785 RepID=UPI002A36BDCA|nr:hypothetical protein [Thiomonas sp.]MDY0329557.1 hypothetical protein [Thiomonas sp.]
MFELYRKHGRKAEFEALYARFQRRFNVAVPPWGADAAALQQSQGRDLLMLYAVARDLFAQSPSAAEVEHADLDFELPLEAQTPRMR